MTRIAKRILLVAAIEIAGMAVAFPVGDGMEISCWTADGLSDENGAL